MPEQLDLEIRRTGFGASEQGAVVGVDAFTDLRGLYDVKIHGVVVPPSWPAQLGTWLQDPIIDIYSHITHREVEKFFTKTFRHPKSKRVFASPDALVIGESRGVDAKLNMWFQRHKYGSTPDEMPESVFCQVQMCMEILEKNYWDIGLLSGDQYKIIGAERDREFGAFLVDASERAWDRWFEPRIPPPIGTSRATLAWLKKTYPDHKRPDMRPATAEEIEMLRQYDKVRVEQKAIEKARDLWETRFKEAIKDREGLEWPGGRLTWRKAKDSKEMDWHSLALALLTHYVKDEAAQQKLLADYNKTTPGSRRMLYKSDSFSEEVSNAA